MSCDCQDGQHGCIIPYKSPRGFTVAYPKQACTLSPPLGSGQVPLLESDSCPWSLEPRSRLSVETEAQVGGVDVEPTNGSPDLEFVTNSFASGEDEMLHMLCPGRALNIYVDRSSHWRKSPQFLLCFCALAVSKHIISHWVRDANSLAYEVRGLSSPLRCILLGAWHPLSSYF